MSGIFGIINKNSASINANWMNQMAENLKHRGLDGESIWIEGSAGLGHQMLFTTPESVFEKLPLHYEKWVITADARIDNRTELFQLLDTHPNEQEKITDSFLILNAFEKWGDKCLDYLIGDFSFAIWDKIDHQLFCAIDHIGIKQFCFFESSEVFVFATEIKAIAELDFVPKKLNENKLKEFLLNIRFGGKYKSETFIEGVKILMPANFLILDKNNLKIANYWKPRTTQLIQYKDEKDYAIALKTLIERAIKDRIRTNYPIGVELSGGLDSSSIACIAARMLAKEDKKLFSTSSVLPMNYTGTETDERFYISEVLNQEKNIVPFFVSAPNNNIFENLESVLDKTYSPVNAFFYIDDAISQCFNEKAKTRIILSGFIGDMAVSNQGHSVLVSLFKKGRLKTIFDLLKKRELIYQKAKYKFIVHEIILKLLPQWFVKIFNSIRGKSQYKYEFLVNSLINEKILKSHELLDLNKKFKLQNLESTDFHEGLWDIDVNWVNGEKDSRASYFDQVGVYPFSDKRIIDFLYNVPEEHFLANGWSRGLIRQAMDGILPAKIQFRKDKKAFSPAWKSKIINELPFILNLLKSEHDNFKEFVDIIKITRSLSKNVSFTEKNNNINLITIFNGIVAVLYLKCIKKS